MNPTYADILSTAAAVAGTIAQSQNDPGRTAKLAVAIALAVIAEAQAATPPAGA
jgi:hypothetical protein